MFLHRETFGLHVFDVIGESPLHFEMEVRILLDELGRETIEQTEQVMGDQNLSVTACSHADTNGGDGNSLRDQFANPCGDRFKHDAEAACRFEQQCIFEECVLLRWPSCLLHGIRRID